MGWVSPLIFHSAFSELAARPSRKEWYCGEKPLTEMVYSFRVFLQMMLFGQKQG